MEIYTAMDIASRHGLGTNLALIRWNVQRAKNNNMFWGEFIPEIAGQPVQAFIDHQRWLATCECGGSEYVDPEAKIFYCMAWQNDENGGKLRNVIFFRYFIITGIYLSLLSLRVRPLIFFA